MRMLLSLILALLGTVQVTPPAALQSKDGVIEVIVRDSLTKAPIPSARITFVFQQTPPPNIVTYVNADESGQAIFKDLAPGIYTVDATRPGYIRPVPIQNILRVIGPENKKHQVEVNLIRGATVTGRFLDPNGIPIVEQSVYLATLTYRDARRTLARAVFGSSQLTNDRGEYRIVGVPPGEYYVQAELRSYGDWSGVYETFPKVIYHPASVDPRAATTVTVRGSQDLSGIDIKIPNVRTFRVSGTVINPFGGGLSAGNGSTNRQVSSFYLAPNDPDSIEDAVLVASQLTPSKNPDESIFEIAGVLPGSYYLYPIWSQGRSAGDFITARIPLVVSDHDVTELKTTLRTNSDVKGRVIVEGNATSLDLRSIRIGLRRKERLPTLVGGTLLSSAQLANPSTGEFTLAGLQESRFGVTVAGLPQDAYVSDVRQNGRSVFDEGIVVDGTAAPLEITLNLQGGSVTGVVRDATATPSARTTVTLVPAVARRGNPQYYKRAITDPNGQFTFRGVAPGEYKLFAWVSPPPGQAEENAQFISTYEGRGTAASVTPGGASNLQLTVIATQ